MRTGLVMGCCWLVLVGCGGDDGGSDKGSTGGSAGTGASSATGGSSAGGAGGAAGSTSGGAAGTGTGGASGGAAGTSGAGGSNTGGGSSGGGSNTGGSASGGSGGSNTGGTSGGGGTGGSNTGGSASGGSGGSNTGGTSGGGGAGGFAGNGFVVDHTSIALFAQIPDAFVTAARNTHMVFSDRSVGQNINEALDCLAAPSWAESPAACRRDYVPGTNFAQNKLYTAADLTAGTVPPRIQFPASSVKYNRQNWVFEYRQGTWSELTKDFVTALAPSHVGTKSVLSYQFSYLNVMDGETIASPTTGFFANTASNYDIHDLEAYIAQNPSKTFVFWTTSLARSIGTKTATDFNAQMRQYASQHGKILIDFADIESHTDTGVPCYDNVTTDGANYPAICQDYTTETVGGHLGSVSAGKILAGKAFWVAMARIAGWNP